MRIFLKIIIAINLVALVITIAMQAFTNVYHFTPSRQFSGETIVNPYQGIDSAKWRKANFHAHQRWLVGLDYNYTGEEFIEAYRKQDYDIVGLADHQQINPYGHIPSYEHGMGMNNFHLLMLGADKVSWFNYPIMALPENQMQYMLDKLKPRAKLLGINHTSRARFSSVDVFENIMGYDMMEMTPDLDPTAWDIALSNGIHSTLIANDDSHTITNRARAFQHTFTMLNTPSLAEDDIISALKQGRAYGVSVSSLRNQTEHPHVGLPVLRSIALLSDTIRVEFDTRADSVLFIGQDAKVLARVVPTDSLHSASYKFALSDTYVRVQAYFKDEAQIWTNPFYRTGGSVREAPSVIRMWTVINSVAWSVLAISLLWYLIRLFRRKKVNRDSYYR